MEDRLKQFIETHRAAFDDDPLPEGHFERFEAKLPTPRPRRLRIIVLTACAAAACAAFALITLLPADADGNDGAVCELGREADEVKLFYHMQMNDIITQMEDMYAQSRVPGAAELLKETRKIQLDSDTFDKKVLPTLPCSPDGLSALNQHYGNSLGSMRQMLGHMTQLIAH